MSRTKHSRVDPLEPWQPTMAENTIEDIGEVLGKIEAAYRRITESGWRPSNQEEYCQLLSLESTLRGAELGMRSWAPEETAESESQAPTLQDVDEIPTESEWGGGRFA